MKKLLLSLLSLGVALHAQPVNLQPISFCKGQTPALIAFINSPTFAGVTVPICVAFGSGLTVTANASGQYVLNASASIAPAQAYPSMYIETVSLTTAGSTDSILQYNLAHAPAPNTIAFVLFQSSQMGMSIHTVVQPAGSSIQLTLPKYRPFTADDVATIVYFSLN